MESVSLTLNPKDKQEVINLYKLFHKYITNTKPENISYKKLDRLINVLYFNWPPTMDLYKFESFRKEYRRDKNVENQLNSVKNLDNEIIVEGKKLLMKLDVFLPILFPEEILEIYSLGDHFKLGRRGWCEGRYRIYSISPNEKPLISELCSFLSTLKVIKQINNSDKDTNLYYLQPEINKYFNKIFSGDNISKKYRYLIPESYYDNNSKYITRFNNIKELGNGNKYEPHIELLMKTPMKIITEYSLDKIYNISRGEFPNCNEWIFTLKYRK